MVNYVAGFLFDYALEKVALIEKIKPDWQKGLLNGIGGKIENEETAHEAMQREFHEETGVVIDKFDWEELCFIEGKDYTVQFFYVVGDAIDEVKTMEKEKVVVVSTATFDNYKVIENLKWLVPIAIDKINSYSGTITIN